MVGVLSVLGIVASARVAIAPPERSATPPRPGGGEADLAAESYAVQFARQFLSWSADAPNGDGTLEGFTGDGLEPNAGLVPPARGAERVEWAEAVQAREPQAGTHVFTIAAETVPLGLRYLAVPVERTPSGSLALAGYPAFVGAPASVPASTPARLAGVTDASLALVVRRALGNYLADSSAELAADLGEGTRVSPPSPGLRLLSLSGLEWAPGGGAVVATARVSGALGARYTLSYEIDVLRSQGRWEITAIETDPDA